MQDLTTTSRFFSTILRGVLCLSIASTTWSQLVVPIPSDSGGRVTPVSNTADAKAVPAAISEQPKGPTRVANYVLGSEDTITIHAFQADELSNKPVQIAGDGYINLPMLGRLKAAGMTVSELENNLSDRLKVYIQNPQVTVFVSDYRSQPVSVVGSVGAPGVVQLRGRKTLVEVIALAGGLKPEAGNIATITRELSVGRVPLPDAADDAGKQYSVAHVNLHSVMAAQNPQDNILIQANDVIMIPKAPLLYIVGQVQKPGGYAITERNSLTVLQAVALAGGLTTTAAPKKARILYQTAGVQTRTEVPTNVRKILDGEAPDVELHAEDILFVPSNLPKSIGAKALETAIGMSTALIWKY